MWRRGGCEWAGPYPRCRGRWWAMVSCYAWGRGGTQEGGGENVSSPGPHHPPLGGLRLTQPLLNWTCGSTALWAGCFRCTVLHTTWCAREGGGHRDEEAGRRGLQGRKDMGGCRSLGGQARPWDETGAGRMDVWGRGHREDRNRRSGSGRGCGPPEVARERRAGECWERCTGARRWAGPGGRRGFSERPGCLGKRSSLVKPSKRMNSEEARCGGSPILESVGWVNEAALSNDRSHSNLVPSGPSYPNPPISASDTSMPSAQTLRSSWWRRPGSMGLYPST